MAVRNIVLYAQNAAALRKQSRPVRRMSRSIQRLVHDLKDTLAHSSDGIGLAAPQNDVHRRVVAVCLGSRNEERKEPDPPVVLIDPQIIEAGDEQRDLDGCLSFPGLYAETVRPHYLRVTGLDESGRAFDRVFEGFDALVVHHEIDHLDGVLYRSRATHRGPVSSAHG
jgi:peptide deformylase